MVTLAKKKPAENVKEFHGSKNLLLDGLPLGGKSDRSLPLRDITASMMLADGGRVVGQNEVGNSGTDGEETVRAELFEDQDTDGAHFPNVSQKFWRSTTWQSHSAPPSPSPSPRQLTGFGDNRKPFPLTPRPLQPVSKVRPPPLQPPRQSIDGSGDVDEGLPSTPGGRRDMKGLLGPGMKLDLGAVQRNRDTSEPTEMQLKRDKFAFFDKECSRVADHIYLGSDSVAKNRETLRENGITHVLNCVGFVCPEYFREDLSYKTLWLQDSPSEDITSILYDVFDYFEEVREQGGRVFVHCCQGVSRSTSLVIAYLMWRDGRSFEDAFQDVKAARGVTNPNMGFACQLLQCQKRVHATPVSPNSALRMYRMAPHSPYDPLHLVPKTVNHPAASALDSRGAFVVHVPGALFVWQGSKSDAGMVVAAQAFTQQVVQYERAQGKNVQVFEGKEPSEFWEALRKEMPQSERTAEHQDPDAGKENGSPKPRRDTVSGAVCRTVKQLPVYNTDYSLYQRAKDRAVMPVEHGPPRDSGWNRLRHKFFSGSGGKSMLVREGVDGAGDSQPVSKVGSKSEGPGKGCLATMVVSGPAPSPDPSQCSSASPFSFSSNSSHSPPFLTSPCMSPPPSPLLSVPHSPSPKSAPAWSPISGEAPSSHTPFPSLDHFPSQLESRPFSCSSTKGPTLSLAQRRGGVSPSLHLPSLVDGAPMTPRRKPELPPISTGNVTECNRFAADTHDTLCEFSTEDRGREALPDPDNNMVLQDVGKQTISFATRSASLLQEDVALESAESLPILKRPGLEGRAVELYEWPQMEKIDMFTEDDLDTHAAYILVVPDAPSGVGGHVYVWVGRGSRTSKGDSPEEDGDVNRASEDRWIIIGQDLLRQWQLRQDIPVKVVEDGNEPDEFWEYFVNG